MKTLGEIAKYVDGKLEGDPRIEISSIVHPALVRGPGDLALVLSANVLDLLKRDKVTSAIAPAELASLDVPNYILVSRPRLALARLLELFERPVYSAEGIHPSAVIDPTAKIGENVSVGPHCWVGPNSTIGMGTRLICNVSLGADVEIGEKALLHPGVSVGDRCKIGNRVIIQPGACGPRSAKNAPNTNSEISRPSTIRSTATVPSAAVAEIPRLRISAGRTNSPSRAGSARIAMNPTDEMASSGPTGIVTPRGASR